MNIEDIKKKQDLYEVIDDETQLSAEEFNTVIDEVRNHKEGLQSKFGYIYYSDADNLYFIFADEEGKDLYYLDPIANADQLLGQFEAPAPYSAEITMLSDYDNIILLSDTENKYINFTFNIVNKNGSPTGDGVTCLYTFSNGNTKYTDTKVYKADTEVNYLIPSQYLTEGVNRITVSITGRNTFAATTARITYNVINLGITTTFDFKTPKDKSQQLVIPYTVSGAGVKFVEWYVDNEFKGDERLSVDSNVKYLDISDLEEGKHNIQFRAFVSNESNKYYSNIIYRDFVTTGSSTVVLISTERNHDEDPTSKLSFNAQQYEQISFDWAVYNKGLQSTVNFSLGTKSIGQYTAYDGNVYQFNYTPTTNGENTLNISCGSFEDSYQFDIDESSTGIKDTEDYVFNLSASGRSNGEVNPKQWSDNGVSVTFNDGFKFSGQTGWVDNALVIANGDSIELDYKPLATDKISTSTSQGFTIELELETTDVKDENVVLCDCTNGGTGFSITATSAKIQGSAGSNVNTKYRDGERIRLAFIVNRVDNVADAKFMYIVNNGILERADQYVVADSFIVDKKLSIGGTEDAIIKLYSIRVYDRAINIEEAFSNYAANSGNTKQVISNNDVYTDGTTIIDMDKVSSKLPVMMITDETSGNTLEWLMGKADKSLSIRATIEYTNIQEPNKSFKITHGQVKLQGTSSLNYPRKNFKIYAGSKCDDIYDYLGEPIPSKKYAFRDKSIPVDCWCLKADFAESSGTHNTGIAKLWGDAMKDMQIDGNYVGKTPAQIAADNAKYKKDVRTTVDGFPIVLFYKNKFGQITCLGQYNFNNDKSTEAVYGFIDIKDEDNKLIYDAPDTVECWEVKNNTHDLSLFNTTNDWNTEVYDATSNKNVKNWTLAFEGRFPDGNTNTTRLKAFADWMVSCKNNQSKFNSEFKDHLDLYKVAAYYVYVMRFGAVDQMVKNAMFTTFDGTHWFFINYDNDTVMGVRNDGKLIYDYTIDRTTLDPDQEEDGGHAYAGYNSTLWNMLEGCTEFMNAVKVVDQALYQSGVNYKNCCQIFDTEQSDQWCERIYNNNGHFKYIQSGLSQYYPLLQGKRKSHRHWWLKNRFDIYDAKWVNGEYRNKFIEFLAPEAPVGTEFTVTSNKELQYGWGVGNTIYESGIKLDTNESHTFSTTMVGSVGDVFKIYGVSGLEQVNISDFSQRITRLDIKKCAEDLQLKKLVIGKSGVVNNSITTIGGINDINSDYVSSLEYIDITGYKKLTGLDLTKLNNLKTFIADNSGYPQFIPANGVNMNKVSLSDAIQIIRLNNASITEFTYNPTSILREVVINNSNVDSYTLVNNWIDILNAQNNELLFANATLNLSGIHWEGVNPQLMKDIKKLGNVSVTGYVKFTSFTYQDYLDLTNLYGENVFDVESALKFDGPTMVLIQGPENNEMAGDQTVQLKTIVIPATTAKASYELFDETGSKISPVSGIATYKAVTLNCNTGELTSTITPTDVIFKIRSTVDSNTSELIQFKVRKVIDPTSLSVSGVDTISSIGTYDYTVSSIPATATEEVINLSASINTDEASVSMVGNKVRLILPDVPSDTIQCTITVTGTNSRTGATISGTKKVTLERLPVNNIIISGASSISDLNDYTYSITGNRTDGKTPNINIKGFNCSADIAQMTIQKASNQFVLRLSEMPSKTSCNVTVDVILEDDSVLTKTLVVSTKFIPTITIDGPASGIAKNGIWSDDYTFVYTPSQYNVSISLVDVVSSNASVKVSNKTKDGFTLSTTDITANTNASITATISVDGSNRTISSAVALTYKQIFNEFKVYANSAWVVPTSNIEVKVGNVPTTYIGDGLWLVDESLVDESMDVTAGGVVVGKYGLNEYSDDTIWGDRVIERFSSPSKRIVWINPSSDKCALITEIYDDVGAYVSKTVLYPSSTNNDASCGRYGANLKGCPFIFDTENLYIQTNGSQITTIISYKLKDANPFTPDLSLPSTSLIAKNGDLNELITLDTPNTSDITITNITSSNSAISASIEDNKIKLTGTIADGNPQSSKLTIYYSINGYSRSVEINVNAEYKEVIEYEAVDLGLPSGRLWANIPIGGVHSTLGYKEFFAWGDVIGKSDNDCDTFKWEGAPWPESGPRPNILDAEHDAATVNMGDGWRMPDPEDFYELKSNCTLKNEARYVTFTSKINNNSIQIPNYGGSINSVYGHNYYQGYFWTRVCNNNSTTPLLFYCASASDCNVDTRQFAYAGIGIIGVKDPS